MEDFEDFGVNLLRRRADAPSPTTSLRRQLLDLLADDLVAKASYNGLPVQPEDAVLEVLLTKLEPTLLSLFLTQPVLLELFQAGLVRPIRAAQALVF